MAGLMSGISRGLSAAGYAGGELFSRQALDEQRAKLEEEKALRIADALEARKAAPMQQFSGLMSAKMAEQVPQEAASVNDTGLTLDSAAQSIGKRTYNGQEQDATGITGNSAVVGEIMKKAQDTLRNPTASAQQKADAQGLLDQMQGQIKAQGDINAKSVEGKTRGRTFDEARDAAREEAALTNPRAFMAGEAMFSEDRKTAKEENRLQLQEKLKNADIAQRDRAEAGKDRRHKEEMDALYAKIDAHLNKKEGGDRTALIQNAEYLKSLGYSDDKIEKFIFDKKELPLEDVAAKILAGDKMGDMTPEQAAQKAVALRNALDGKKQGPIAALPTGAKQIGTSGGKPVYQTPDGKKFIAN